MTDGSSAACRVIPRSSRLVNLKCHGLAVVGRGSAVHRPQARSVAGSHGSLGALEQFDGVRVMERWSGKCCRFPRSLALTRRRSAASETGPQRRGVPLRRGLPTSVGQPRSTIRAQWRNMNSTENRQEFDRFEMRGILFSKSARVGFRPWGWLNEIQNI